MKRIARIAALIGAATMIVPATAGAEDYPARPIRVLTTTSAGGISDIFMRALGEELRQRLGQPLVVENRPGGMQNVGARACTEAPPDGYTICILNADPLVYNQFLLKNMPFDPEKGLAPITNLFHLIQTLVVNSSLEVKSVDELVALSKQKAGTLSYLTAAPPLALYMEKLKEEKGADWVRVPFKGGGEAVNAVLSGTTPIALIGEGNVIGQVRGGKMKLLVMVNNIKSPNFPEVPTMEETGYKGAPSRSWYGLFAPAGTPKPIVDRLAKEVAAVVGDPAFHERHLTARSLVPAINSPDEFAQQIKADRAAAERVVKDAGLTPQ
jgi:tripartite-type tricarboxylate transporter receptor subunit TctC